MAWDSKKSHQFAPKPQGQTGVIKLNLLYFAVCLLVVYLNYSSGLFKCSDVGFSPLHAFEGQFYNPKCVVFHLLFNISLIVAIGALECTER